MEEKFHLLVALTRLVTVNERNIDTYYFIGEPSEVNGDLIFLIREDDLLVVDVKGHGVKAPVTHDKDSSVNCYRELIVLLPEIKHRFAGNLAAQYFRLLKGSKEIAIELIIKRMRTDRQARKVDYMMVLLAHRCKIGCKITTNF